MKRRKKDAAYSMRQLPGNCRMGSISIHPENWETVKAKVNIIWYVKYRFYDDNLGVNKQVVLKGMNDYFTLAEKQDAVRTVLKDEIELIVQKGYNPVTKTYYNQEQFPEQETVNLPDPGSELYFSEVEDLTQKTPFIEALYFALPEIKCVSATHIDIASVLKYVRIGAMLLGLDRLPVGQIKRKNIIAIFKKVGEVKLQLRKKLQEANPDKTIKENWTANTFNQYRSHLQMVFKALVKLEVIEINIIEGIDKEKHATAIRETLTPEQRITINGFLFQYHYNFWRFLQMFFHSGTRIIEILKVRKEDVDLLRQRFKVLIKKGGAYRYEWRTIKNIVLHLWEEILQETGEGQVLFSEGLQPGDHVIRREQITRRWRRHVKERFKVIADFYSLKHQNTEEVMDALAALYKQIEEAESAVVKMNGHTSPQMLRTVYDKKNALRRANLVREVNNEFAPGGMLGVA